MNSSIHPNFHHTRPFTQTSIHPLIHLSSIHPFIHSFTHAFIHPSIRPSIHPSVHLPIHPSIHPSIHSFIHSFIHPLLRSVSGSFVRRWRCSLGRLQFHVDSSTGNQLRSIPRNQRQSGSSPDPRGQQFHVGGTRFLIEITDNSLLRYYLDSHGYAIMYC